MKLKNYVVITLLTIIFMVTGCNEIASVKGEFNEAATLTSASSNSTEATKIESILKKMTINEKIGQMMMIGISGYEVDDNIAWMLSQYHCGGIILYDRNMKSKIQVKNFLADIQSKSAEAAA